MRLDSEEIDVIKKCLQDSSCNWCGGDVILYGVSKIERPKVQGVVQCEKCDRINPATFKMPE